MNIPYRRQYDAAGNLINPIGPEGYKNNFPNRRERRQQSGTRSTRPFSNKKGIQLVVTQFAPGKFTKFEKKIIKQGETGTRLQFHERVNKK
jgi:hypothetical protein